MVLLYTPPVCITNSIIVLTHKFWLHEKILLEYKLAKPAVYDHSDGHLIKTYTDIEDVLTTRYCMVRESWSFFIAILPGWKSDFYSCAFLSIRTGKMHPLRAPSILSNRSKRMCLTLNGQIHWRCRNGWPLKRLFFLFSPYSVNRSEIYVKNFWAGSRTPVIHASTDSSSRCRIKDSRRLRETAATPITVECKAFFIFTYRIDVKRKIFCAIFVEVSCPNTR